jgi:DNA-binding CsgD family transcriptional regulator/tetratricopeptide (TPR) repeat protein
MDGGAGRPAGVRGHAAQGVPPGMGPLVGRADALRAFREALDASGTGSCCFLSLVGEPGAGKTRLLGELAAEAARGGVDVLAGRAAGFEQEMPFGVVVDALDDQVESGLPGLATRLGAGTCGLLATVLPSLRAAAPGLDGPADPEGPARPGPGRDLTGRYRIYRGIRRLLEDLAAPHGLVLILDDLHWADNASVGLLDHLVRHPPRGRVLVAMAYRPAQARARLAALLSSATVHARQLPVGPLTFAETEELLGPGLSRPRCQALHEASGGNPFYLRALARMDHPALLSTDGAEMGELAPEAQVALQLELAGLSPAALLAARAAAVVADEFEPALAAVAAEITESEVLAALNEVAARDIVRPRPAGRLRFRHPLMRRAAYDGAAPGWRLGAHARIAAHLAGLGAPAARQAPHVERSARFGDRAAVATLLGAAREVAPQAPATAARWLETALRIMPPDGAGPGRQLELLLEVAGLRAVSGQAAGGREAAREVLRRLPPRDHTRRAEAARFCALTERQLDRPQEAQEVLLVELRRIPGPQSAAVPLQTRLVAESLMGGDVHAAQTVLDLIPDHPGVHEPSAAVAIAALRPLPASALGRDADAARLAEVASRLVAAAPDDHLAGWLDAVAWLCWTETMMGRQCSALAHFDRALTVARSTGQLYIISNLLAGQARVLTLAGRLAEAAAAADEAAETARLLGSGHQLALALSQQCLAASWAGEHKTAVRLGQQAAQARHGTGGWTAVQAQYALATALINAGRRDAGRDAMVRACDQLSRPALDRRSLVAACEVLASVEADHGRRGEASRWADRAAQAAGPAQEGSAGLARAHVLLVTQPHAAAKAAHQAAETFTTAGLLVDSGRARLRAGQAYAAAGQDAQARAELAAAAQTLTRCGARSLRAATVREQRRLGVRVRDPAAAGRRAGPHGLTHREMEVVKLVGEGYTNQQIAGLLFVSVRTVETHLSHIFAKLGVATRTGILPAISQSSQGPAATGP